MSAIHDATLSVLKASGTDALKDADRFRGLVITQLDGSLQERRALELGCDEKYLEVFSGAGDKDELSAAARAAADYLTDAYVMNPEVAASVSYEIAGAIAEFLGVDAPSVGRRRRSAAKRRGFSIPATIALVLSLCLLVAGLYAAHLNPIFGCTLFPGSGEFAGISCDWYGIRNAAGQELTVIFLKNDGEDTKRLSSADNHALRSSVMPSLATGDEGLMVIQGLGGMTYVKARTILATKESLESMATRRVTWSFGTSANGSERIQITNPTEEKIRLYANSIMLASKGATVKVCVIEDLEYLKPGTTEIDVVNKLRPITPHSGGMKPSANTDLYLNGVKVPFDSEE